MTDGAITTLVVFFGGLGVAGVGAVVRATARVEAHNDRLEEHERRLGALEDGAVETNRLVREQHGWIQRILGILEGKP